MASAAGGGYVPNAAYPSMMGTVPSFAPNSTNHDVGQIVLGQSLDYFPVAANLTVVKRVKNDPVYDITQNQLTMLHRNPETTNGPNFIGEALTVSAVNCLLFEERLTNKNGLKLWEDWALNGIASSNSVPKSDERAARLMFMISLVARGRFPVFLFSNEKVIHERDRVHLVLAKYRRESSGLIVKLPTDSNAHLTSTEVVPAPNIFEGGKEDKTPGIGEAKTRGSKAPSATTSQMTGPKKKKSPVGRKPQAVPPASERLDVKYPAGGGDGGDTTSNVGGGTIPIGGSGNADEKEPSKGTIVIGDGGDGDDGDDGDDKVPYPSESPTADDEFWQFGFEVTRAGTNLNASDYMYTKDNDSKKRWIGYCKPNIGQIGSLGDAGLISLEPNEIAAVNQFMHPGPNRRWMNLAGPDQSSMVKVLLVLN